MLEQAWQFLATHPAQFATALGVHVALSAAALAIAATIAIPTGIYAAHRPRAAFAAINVANAIAHQTLGIHRTFRSCTVNFTVTWGPITSVALHSPVPIAKGVRLTTNSPCMVAPSAASVHLNGTSTGC